MRIQTAMFGGLLMILGVVAVAESAPSATYKRDVPASLAAEAKVAESVACKSALSHVKNGKIVALELEREDGLLIYSIDVKVFGKSGIEEVHVNALDGRVLSIEHESAANERAEAAAEKK